MIREVEGPTRVSGRRLWTFYFSLSSLTDNSLVPELDAEIYVWEGTLTDGNIDFTMKEKIVLHGAITGAGWFGAWYNVYAAR